MSLSILLSIYSETTHPEVKESPALMICVGIGFVGVLIYGFWLHSRQFKYWDDGIFPAKLKYNRENLMYAQICMAALIMHKDRMMVLDKMLYVERYFRTKFYDVSDSYKYVYHEALRKPTSYESVATWLNNQPEVTVPVKVQFVQFLMALSGVDGMMNQAEYTVISKFMSELKLDQKLLNDFVTELNGRERATAKPVVTSGRKHFAAVLGLEETASKDEIKKTYRRLVKLYHPDRFQQETANVQQKSKEKFQELQQAYDWLMEN